MLDRTGFPGFGGSKVVAQVITKLAQFVDLAEDDKLALAGAVSGTRQIGARRNVVRVGAKPQALQLIAEGYAFRYVVLPDGRRQIIALLLPGDLCNPHFAICAEIDHSIETLTPVVIAEVPIAAANALLLQNPNLDQAMRRSLMADEGMARERIIDLGRRSAKERLGHFICEVFERCRAVGLAQGMTSPMPICQDHLADILGLSLVHVNRSLQALRQAGLLQLKGRVLNILRYDELKEMAHFDATYLRLSRATAQREQAAASAARPALGLMQRYPGTAACAAAG